MSDKWSNYDPSNHAGPFTWVMRIFLLLLALSLAIGGVNFAVSYFTGTARVIQEETNPRTLLDKYRWFKQASAALDAKRSNIAALEARLASLNDAYKDESGKIAPRNQWTREDREESSQISAEISGLKADFNGLAAQYNAAMSDISFRFTNVGQLPQGADQPLPREFKPYQ